MRQIFYLPCDTKHICLSTQCLVLVLLPGIVSEAISEMGLVSNYVCLCDRQVKKIVSMCEKTLVGYCCIYRTFMHFGYSWWTNKYLYLAMVVEVIIPYCDFFRMLVS